MPDRGLNLQKTSNESGEMTPTPSQAPGTVVHRSFTVLIVEDSKDNRALLTFMLRRAGMEVACAEHGLEALHHVDRSKREGNLPDLILLDMAMPVMDGYATARELRRRGWARPIVALTAYTCVHDRQKCLDAGCSDYLTKPVDRRQLVRVLSQWLGIDLELRLTTRPTTDARLVEMSPEARTQWIAHLGEARAAGDRHRLLYALRDLVSRAPNDAGLRAVALETESALRLGADSAVISNCIERLIRLLRSPLSVRHAA
jgi:CheY-like chemotaxis protein